MDNNAASSSGDDSYQPIIPGLPDDLALRCLARLSHGYHGMLELVCKRWRDSIRSLEYAHVKAQEGRSGNWLFVSTEDQINGQWIAYDPEADRWHSLPPIPFTNTSKKHWGFSCVCVEKKFLLIGGYYESLSELIPTSDVLKFDPFSNQWSRVASMRVARANFACAVVHGKVYVAGGRTMYFAGGNSLTDVEVYDPAEDSWQDVAPLPSGRESSVGFSYGGLFFVVAGKNGHRDQKTAQILAPVKGRWYSLQKFWPFFLFEQRPVAIVKDYIYTIDDWKGNGVNCWHRRRRCWIKLGSVPSVKFPGHSHALKAFGFGVIGFQNEMYVIGGKAVKSKPADDDRQTVEIVKLNLVRICKISGAQLEWREVRPMRGSQGSVLGCAVLEE